MSLSQKLPTGWFLSVPLEEGSETFAYRWVEIDGNWLFVSNRHNDPCIISLNLAMANHYPTNNSNYISNSLTIECNGIQGYKSIIFSTLNRFDLLAFNNAISEAKTYWQNYITDGNTFEDCLLECSDITNSTIGVDAEISIVQNSLHVKRVLSEPEEIPIIEISRIVPTLYDPYNGISFELIHNNNTYVFKARKHKDMITFINAVQCIHSTEIKPQAISGMPISPQVIQISQPVMIEGQSQPQVMVFQLQQPINAMPHNSSNRGNQPSPLQVASFITQPLVFPAGSLPSPQEVAQIVTQSIPQLLQQSQGIQNTSPSSTCNMAYSSGEGEPHNLSQSYLTPSVTQEISSENSESIQNSPPKTESSQNYPSNYSSFSQPSNNSPIDSQSSDAPTEKSAPFTSTVQTVSEIPKPESDSPEKPIEVPNDVLIQPPPIPNTIPPSIEPPPMEEEEDVNDPFDEEEFF